MRRLAFFVTSSLTIFLLISGCSKNTPLSTETPNGEQRAANTFTPNTTSLLLTSTPSPIATPTNRVITPTTKPNTPLPTMDPTVTSEPISSPKNGEPYQNWAWPDQDITIWIADLTLNTCDSGTVWFCDPQWNPEMYEEGRSVPPDLRVFGEGWRLGGKAKVDDEVEVVSFIFPLLAKDIVINYANGPYLIDHIVGILPSGERVPMGYALSDGVLTPTFLFMDTYMFNDTFWYMEAEMTGKSPASVPCGMVGLEPDQNFTVSNKDLLPDATMLFRMLDLPATQVDTLTMGENAYELAGLEINIKKYTGIPYKSCNDK